MKYPVFSCPECGCGDAEEDAKGVGLILGFHPQDPTHLKLPGTIYFIGCNHCQYVGPIVLCKNGLNELSVINAWNDHIRPGSSLTTVNLVRELEKRDGATLYAHLEPGQIVSIISKPEDYDFVEGVSGPAKILVVVD